MAELNLPDSTNGALLVLSVAGFGLSVYYQERFLSFFFFGIIAITGSIWVFFLSLSIFRNWKAFKETDYRVNNEYKNFLWQFLLGLFIIWCISIIILSILS
jgi:hypothetical protein